MERLTHYTWPGNVGELENAIERACALAEDTVIKATDLPPQVLEEAEKFESHLETEWQVGQRLDGVPGVLGVQGRGAGSGDEGEQRQLFQYEAGRPLRTPQRPVVQQEQHERHRHQHGLAHQSQAEK